MFSMHSPPAWSMGGSKRSTDWRNDAPGPGSYNAGLHHKSKSPGWKIGNASRSVDERNDVPGPGQYNSPGKVSKPGPKYSIAGKHPHELDSFSPGPGAYDATALRGYDHASPSYTMRPKTANTDRSFGPGPGAYDQGSKIRNQASPGYRIGSSKRDGLYNSVDTPGPGTYQVRPNSAGGPQFGFGTADRDGLYGDSAAPGPGQYNFKGAFESPGKGTSMVPRRPESALSSAPGPGAYDPTLSNKNVQPAFRIGTAPRDSVTKQEVPGPGNYELKPSKSGPNIRIGTSVRSPINGDSRTPGPGTYDATGLRGTDQSAPAFSFKGKTPAPQGDQIPGPGTYDQSSRVLNQTSPGYKIGTAPRSGLYNSVDTPGPGTYNNRPKSAFNAESGPKFAFGTAERDGLYGDSTTPGPGQYTQKGVFESPGKGTTIIPRRPESAVTSSRIPGPGSYDPTLGNKPSQPAFRIGSASRDTRSRDGAPGPGNYEPRFAKTGGNMKFGTSVRSPINGDSRTPGPGTYDGTGIRGQDRTGPAFSFKGKSPTAYGDQVPGPGSYDQSSTIRNQKSPGYKIGTGQRSGLYNSVDTPGPGSYLNRPSSAGPKFGFGTSDREGLYGDSSAPGPGQYTQKGMFDKSGKGTTMVPRRPDSALTASGKAPGPGAYDPTLSNKNAQPAFRIGTAPRDQGSHEGAPGPGQYEPRISKGSPNVKIGTSVRSPIHASNQTPGPGTYASTGIRGGDHVGPSYSMRPRTANPGGSSQAPGPGAYDQTSKIRNQASPGYKIGTGQRSGLYSSIDSPGPGSYGVRPSSAFNRDSGPKYAFGTAGRDGGDMASGPGPGQYSHRGTFEERGKGTTIIPRRPESAVTSSGRAPGPGAYDPSLYDKTSQPAYRMGSASRDGLGKDYTGSPGPGNYDPKLGKGSGVKIGTSVRSPINGDSRTPGPGAYSAKTKVGEGPKYVINPRREDMGEAQQSRYKPGPGAYSPSVEYVKTRSPGIGIGTGNRAGLYDSKSNPGPGQYDTRGRIGGPKWGFGTQSRGDEQKSEVPGPGMYKLPHTVGDVPKYAYGNTPLKIHL